VVRALGPSRIPRCRPQRLNGPLLHLVGEIDDPVRLWPGDLNSDAPLAAEARLVDEPTHHVLAVVPGAVYQFGSELAAHRQIPQERSHGVPERQALLGG
jgi:hypothetical protein